MFHTLASWILLVVVGTLVFITSCITDVVIKVCHRLKLVQASRWSFILLNRFIELLLKLWGTRIEFDTCAMNVDPNRPILFVASHHSSLDVCILGNRLFNAVGYKEIAFICRSGLDRWLPSFSFYARQFCYSLPAKVKTPTQGESSFTAHEAALSAFAERLDSQGRAVIFFPEGVKRVSECEHRRPFRRKGLRILLEKMPNAQIVPIGVAGTRSFFTTPRCLKSILQVCPSFNRRLLFQILPTLQYSQSEDMEQFIDKLEAQISSSYDNLSHQIANHSDSVGLREKWTQ